MFCPRTLTPWAAQCVSGLFMCGKVRLMGSSALILAECQENQCFAYAVSSRSGASMSHAWHMESERLFAQRSQDRPWRVGCPEQETGCMQCQKKRLDEERPCLHCMMVELIDDFFAEYPATGWRSDKVDTGEADEVIDAIAKTVAELTSQQDGTDATATERTLDA